MHVRDLLRRFSPRWRRYLRTRRSLAARYLTGDGLEIGALHMPLPLPSGASVRYVDRKPLWELRSEFPELAGSRIVAPDIVADGARLAPVEDESVDFVVANHFLEHTEDPVGVLEAHARVLRAGGVLYLALPDRRHQHVDRRRTPVSISHHLKDHDEGPEWSRAAHYEEWVRAADVPLGLVEPDAIDAAVADHLRRRTPIHFHAWTREEFLELLASCRERGLPLDVLEAVQNFHEFIVVLRKDD